MCLTQRRHCGRRVKNIAHGPKPDNKRPLLKCRSVARRYNGRDRPGSPMNVKKELNSARRAKETAGIFSNHSC
jgi:hypothetical protein